MNTETVAIMNEGMQCLTERMGVVRAEYFISLIIREKFDYTKWQRDLFEDMNVDDLNTAAANHDKNNRFHTAS